MKMFGKTLIFLIPLCGIFFWWNVNTVRAFVDNMCNVDGWAQSTFGHSCTGSEWEVGWGAARSSENASFVSEKTGAPINEPGKTYITYTCGTCDSIGICQDNFGFGSGGIGNPCSQVDICNNGSGGSLSWWRSHDHT